MRHCKNKLQNATMVFLISVAVLPSCGDGPEDKQPELPARQRPEQLLAAKALERYAYLNDYANVVPDSNEAELNKQLRELEEQTGVEMAILTLPTIRPDYSDHESFARETFERWQLGEPAKQNGILLTAATADQYARISVGKGMESVFSYGLCIEILEESLFPYLREGDYARAFSEGVERIIQINMQRMDELQRAWAEYGETEQDSHD